MSLYQTESLSVAQSIWLELCGPKLSRPQLETNDPSRRSRLLETKLAGQQCASCKYHLEALLLAHRLRVSTLPDYLAQKATDPRQIWGRFCHRVAESRGVCGDLGQDLAASAGSARGLADDWQPGRQANPRHKRSKAPSPRPRGQAGPKRAIGMPQNKAMVRPNPINRPQSTRRYPGHSMHAHWLGFSGVARPAELWIVDSLLAQGSMDCLITMCAALNRPVALLQHLPHSWVSISLNLVGRSSADSTEQ